MYYYLKEEDLNRPEIQLYNERAETNRYRFFEPEPGLFVAETQLVIERAVAAGYEPLSLLGEEKYVKETLERLPEVPEDLPFYIGSHEFMRRIAGYELTRGILCMMRRKPPADIRTVCEGARRIVVLEEVMNPANVGAIFRSAAALGMDAILLTKGCADPLYRRSIRVSMGNVFQIPWTYFRDNLPPEERIALLKELGYFTAAMALSDDAVFLGEEDFSGHEKRALVMGSEFTGLCEETIRACDLTVKIPMKEGVDSLNVAAASAVAFWEMRKS